MRKGVAFIEILIIITIISGIVAFLAPVFATTQTQAGIEQCQARGKKLGAAMLAYMADNDGRYPSPAHAADLAKFNNVTWKWKWISASGPVVRTWGLSGMNEFAYIQLAKYVKDKETWICPAPTTLFSQKFAYGYRRSWFFNGGSGWSGRACGNVLYPDATFNYYKRDANGNILDDYKNGMGRTVSEVLAEDMQLWKTSRSPATKFFAWCYGLGSNYIIEAYSGGPIITPSYPHSEGSIYLFADGHAKYCEMGRGHAPVYYTNNPADLPHPQ